MKKIKPLTGKALQVEKQKLTDSICLWANRLEAHPAHEDHCPCYSDSLCRKCECTKNILEGARLLSQLPSR